MHREQDGKRRPLPRLALDTDGAPVTADDPERRREAEAASEKFGGEERLEDTAARLGIHSGPGISDVDPNVLASDDGEALCPRPLRPRTRRGVR